MRGQGRSTRLLVAVVAMLPVLGIMGVAKATLVRLPVVQVSTPTPSSVVEGVTGVTGTASKGSYRLSKIDVGVDGTHFQRAKGTTSWSASLNTASYGDGPHNLVVRATDR